MRFFHLLLFVSFLSSQNYEIKGAQIKYYGTHFLHDWIGISNDLNGNVGYEKYKNFVVCLLNYVSCKDPSKL